MAQIRFYILVATAWHGEHHHIILHGTYKGINAATVTLSNNKIEKFPSELFTAGSPITTIDLSGNQMRTIPKGSIKGKKAYLLQVIDLRFNKCRTESSRIFLLCIR